jgi:two-component system, chemotaxis family, protein-glutamate methylesterase/glutaminase
MGVRVVKRMGRTVIARDEASSEFFGMPGAAFKTGANDIILGLEEISLALIALVIPSAA